MPPGAYQLANLALPTGAADTRVVVRDAFGGTAGVRRVLLRHDQHPVAGLQQFQYAFGAERLRQFDTMWDYGRPVFAGTHRIGITDALTLGGRIEMESGLVSTGPTLATRLGRFGALELTGGASHAGGRGGVAGGIAYEYTGRPGGVSLAWRQASEGYENLTTRRQQLGMRREVMASTTARLTSRLTLGAGWQAQDADVAEASVRRASVSSSISISQRVSLFVSATRSRLDGLWSNGGFAAMSLSLGPRASARRDGGVDRGRHRGRGERAAVGAGRTRLRLSPAGQRPWPGGELVDGELRAQSTWAQIDVRQSVVNGTRDTWAQVNGALVAIGGRVMATRPVQDGFALVRVPDVKGVRAYISHQEMGRTDRHGDLLLPEPACLLRQSRSRLPTRTCLPTARCRYKQLLLATPYRGGAIAEFPATREWRVTGSLTLLGQPRVAARAACARRAARGRDRARPHRQLAGRRRRVLPRGPGAWHLRPSRHVW